MPRRPPSVVILAGPNGAGKSTTGPSLVKDTLKIVDLVNADTIARGLSAFDPEGAAIQAGRVMLRRLRELSRRGKNFACICLPCGVQKLAFAWERAKHAPGNGYAVATQKQAFALHIKTVNKYLCL